MTMWTSMCIIIFLLFVIRHTVSKTMKTFETEDSLYGLSLDHGAKLANLTHIKLVDISICFRFFNFKVGNHFLMALKWDFFTQVEWSADGNRLLIFQKFNKKFIQPHRQESGWRMTPMEWHTYCFTYHRKTRERKAYIDAVEILGDMMHKNDESLDVSDWFPNNITFMSYGYGPHWTSVDKMADINIWNVTLNQREIDQWTDCKEAKKEYKVVDWNTAEWKVKDIKIGEVDLSAVCKIKSKVEMYQFTFKKTFLESADFCHLLRGKLAVARNNATAMAMRKKCETFAGINDLDVEDQFIDPYTRRQPDEMIWAPHEPNNFGIGEDCTNIQWNGFLNDVSCNLRYCSLCNINNFPQFELRGFCNADSQDIKYQIAVEPSFKEVYTIVGWRKTDIMWNKNQSRWEIIETKDLLVVAFCNSTTEYPFGIQRWYFLGENCADPGKTWRQMNLHQAVDNGEFCCNNGLCIDSELRCDNSIDCEDHSDELDCKTVIFPNFEYKSERPPSPETIKRFPSVITKRATDVNASVEIIQILDIEEVKSEVTIIFSVYLTWRDPRLKFLYLKKSKESNVIDEHIWIPKFTFGNLKENLSDFQGKMEVRRKGVPRENSKTILTMEEIYEGKENPITIKSFYQIKFICGFDNIGLYPFDKEFCSIDIVNAGTGNKFMNYIAEDIKYYGKQTIAQYTVEQVTFQKEMFTKDLNGLKVEIQLGRDFKSIFCVTYLPTILMNIINQSTIYLDIQEFLEAIITVNVTCMMVLSALYISVSNSLPATAAIKYIDIWLLYSLIFPFFIILVSISLYYVQETTSKVCPFDVKEKKSKLMRKRDLNMEWILRCSVFYVNPTMYILFASVYFLNGILFL